MGLSLPYDASYPAVSAAKEREAFLAGKALVRLHREEHPAARHHHPQVAGERLHLRAGPRRLDQRRAAPHGHRPRGRRATWTLDDFDRLGEKVPHLADLKPGGKYVMFDLYRVGGTPAVLQGAARRRASCTATASTVTGQDARREPDGRAEHLRQAADGGAAARQADASTTGIIVILHGNLAPEGAVAKVAGLKQREHHRPGQGLRRRGGLLRRRSRRGRSVAGDVVVIRGEGPVGGPGMREMLVDHRRR